MSHQSPTPVSTWNPPLRQRLSLYVVLTLLSLLLPAWSLAATAKPSAQADLAHVCNLLVGGTEQRVSACCGAPMGAGLMDLCGQTLQPLGSSLNVDAAAFAACAHDLKQYRQDCKFVQQQLPPLPQSCRAVLQGKVAEGGRCQTSLSCADGLYCLGLSIAPSGVCRKPAEVGARCESAHDNLAGILNLNGLPEHRSCVGRCERGQCLPAAQVGEACQHSGQCLESLQCVQGQCQSGAAAAPGDRCDASHFCEFGSICRDGRCQFRKPAGASCHTGFECAALACTKAEGAELGTCAAVCPAGR